MKKKRIIKGMLLAGMTISLSAAILITPSSILGQSPTVVEAAQTAEVTSLDQFKSALLNSNVTEINVTKSFSFKGDIHNIPNRDLVINGNADKGVVITSGINSIYGKQNYNSTNLLSIKNAKIAGDATVGRFFTGGAGNGPSSRGWDVYAEGVTYTGARFIHLSEGKLTFGGTNTINTRAENAWVHSLEFLPNSIYNGVAANKDHGQFSAFYFNGRLVNGKAVGTVKIGADAQVTVKIGPQSNVNYYYPVFYDKVYKVDIDENATLDVDAAGVAFQFIPRADYLGDIPEERYKSPVLNLAKNSKAYFNGRGGGNYATMKLQYYGSRVNVNEGAELVVTGKSKKGVVESEYKGATFNLTAPGNFEITNKEPGNKLFYSTNTTINATDLSEISYWNQLGGDYNVNPTGTFGENDLFNVNFGKLCNSQTLSVNATDATTKGSFRMENYGKISLKGKSNVVPPNPIWNDYRVSIQAGQIVIDYLQADRLELYVNGDLAKIFNISYEDVLSRISIVYSGISSRDVIEVKGFYQGEEVGYGRMN